MARMEATKDKENLFHIHQSSEITCLTTIGRPQIGGKMIDLAYQLTRAGITAKLLKSTARGRQTLLMLKIMESVGPLIEEAAQARVSAPGLLEIMDWCQYCIEQNAMACIKVPELTPTEAAEADEWDRLTVAERLAKEQRQREFEAAEFRANAGTRVENFDPVY